MLSVPCIAGDEVCGDYPRAQLLEMNDRFVYAVEAAFAAGLESRVAAAATVNFRNGKAAAIEGAIEGAFALLVSRRGEMSGRARTGIGRVTCSRFPGAGDAGRAAPGLSAGELTACRASLG